MVNSILGAGVAGIQRGIRDAQENAQTIASANIKDNASSATDIAGPLVDLRVNLSQVQASAKVVETVDDILASLLRSTDTERR